jgi:6-phosphogluconolactonase
MARDALLDHVSIPEKHVHSIDFPDTTEYAAASYAKALSKIQSFDLVMLGMGEDGHTASLFPNNPALENTALAVPVFNSPKPPAERVSISLNKLNNHQQCIILATGSSKQEVLKEIAKGTALPVTLITNATWVVDQAAWPT